MLNHRSLTVKSIYIGLVFVVMLALVAVWDYRFTNHMDGEAAKLNRTGQLRYCTLEMPLIAQKLIVGASRRTLAFPLTFAKCAAIIESQ